MDTLNEDFMSLMMAIFTMYRANDESEVKSKRLSAAWQAKRDDAQENGTKLTGRCPAWLRLVNGEFQVIEARVAVVRQMFDLTLAGYGKGAIAKEFNKSGVPTFGRGQGWHPSYIQKILDSEAVVGTFQPRKNRRPDGPPITDYYPSIVEPATFLQARELRSARRIPGGRTGKTFSNLFTSMAECGHCGAPMHYINKGVRSPGRGLVCSNAKRGNAGCKYVSWQYAPTEHFLLHGLQTVEFSALFPKFNDTAQDAIQSLEKEHLIARDALDKSTRDIATGVRLVFEQPDSAAIAEHLRDLEDAKVGLEKAWESVGVRLDAARSALVAAKTRHAECVTALDDWLRGEGAEDAATLYERRSRLHQLLRQTIDYITFTAPPVMGDHHGDIRVVYQGEPEYTPIIRVDTGQRSAVSDGVLKMKWAP